MAEGPAAKTTATDEEHSGASEATMAQLEQHRRELTGYCYRMLGSSFEAEDAVQETMIRAWRNLDRFEHRASLRTWMYRIATNVCLDMIAGRQRRARPMDFGEAAVAPTSVGETLPEITWIGPIPDARVLPDGQDPAEVAVARETISLAFIAALQHLPARQRAVLILREVLRWKADEVAELLGTTVVSVNSALQRARATLEAKGLEADGAGDASAIDDEQRELLARYLDAFERYDIEALVGLLREDAVLSMPPYPLWLQGPDEIAKWHLGVGHQCRGSRMLPTRANGQLAFGQYRPDGDGGHAPWALQVVETRGDKIVGLNAFLDTEALFPLFGLPEHLPPEPAA